MAARVSPNVALQLTGVRGGGSAALGYVSPRRRRTRTTPQLNLGVSRAARHVYDPTQLAMALGRRVLSAVVIAPVACAPGAGDHPPARPRVELETRRLDLTGAPPRIAVADAPAPGRIVLVGTVPSLPDCRSYHAEASVTPASAGAGAGSGVRALLVTLSGRAADPGVGCAAVITNNAARATVAPVPAGSWRVRVRYRLRESDSTTVPDRVLLDTTVVVRAQTESGADGR